MKRSIYALLALLMVLTLVLSACGKPAASNPVSKFSAFTYQQALQFKQLFADTYPTETKHTALFNEWMAFNDNFYGQLKDSKFLSDNCYSNVDKILQDATIGVFDTQHAADGAPTSGILDQTKMVSALVTNNLYPANADKCSELLQSTFDQMIVGRQKSYEKQVAFIEIHRVLNNQYNDTWGKAASKRFLDLYGQEFMNYANGLLSDNGVEPFPTDFIGFPTSGLSAQTKSMDWFNYYNDIYTGVTRPGTPGFDKSMYMVTWIGPAKGGEATLYRQAAWEFTSRSFRSAATENAVNCGEGAPSLSTTVDENCNEVPNNPSVPTNVPAPTEAIPAEVPATAAP